MYSPSLLTLVNMKEDIMEGERERGIEDQREV